MFISYISLRRWPLRRSHEYWQEVLGLTLTMIWRIVDWEWLPTSEDWDTAIEHFTIANDPDGYSDAFWWARRHGCSNISDAVALVVLWVGVFGPQNLRSSITTGPPRLVPNPLVLGDLQHIKTMPH